MNARKIMCSQGKKNSSVRARKQKQLDTHESYAVYRNMPVFSDEEEEEEEEIEPELMRREEYQQVTFEELFCIKYVPLAKRPEEDASVRFKKKIDMMVQEIIAAIPVREALPKPRRYDEEETDEAIDAYYSLAPWMRYKRPDK